MFISAVVSYSIVFFLSLFFQNTVAIPTVSAKNPHRVVPRTSESEFHHGRHHRFRVVFQLWSAVMSSFETVLVLRRVSAVVSCTVIIVDTTSVCVSVCVCFSYGQL